MKLLVKAVAIFLLIFFMLTMMIAPIYGVAYAAAHPVSFAISIFTPNLDFQERAKEYISGRYSSEFTGGVFCDIYYDTVSDLILKDLQAMITDPAETYLINKVAMWFVAYNIYDYTDEDLTTIYNYTKSIESEIELYDTIVQLPLIQNKTTSLSIPREIMIYYLQTANQKQSTVTNPSSLEGLSIRTESPASDRSNPNFFSSKNWYYAAGYQGQCTWYSIGRVLEMAEQLDLQLDMDTLHLAGSGNGKDFVRFMQYARNPGVYGYSTDVYSPSVGAIICWSGGNYHGQALGHVAVVESVNEDGTISYSEGWTNDSGATISFAYVTKTPEQILNRSGYHFECYCYIITTPENALFP